MPGSLNANQFQENYGMIDEIHVSKQFFIWLVPLFDNVKRSKEFNIRITYLIVS